MREVDVGRALDEDPAGNRHAWKEDGKDDEEGEGLLRSGPRLGSLPVATGPAPTEWNMDVPHTGIGFTVRHLFTPVEGRLEA